MARRGQKEKAPEAAVTPDATARVGMEVFAYSSSGVYSLGIVWKVPDWGDMVLVGESFDFDDAESGRVVELRVFEIGKTAWRSAAEARQAMLAVAKRKLDDAAMAADVAKFDYNRLAGLPTAGT